ncbi:DUF3883 domain-containing protein [Ancylobacter sp. VNQ12]|uniref:DUF3883 domain-containing protein n=1 Tax=Ancylobacter sp. VNQ12 TaxID=3400920 RepID=UPI003C022FC0
MFVNIGWMTNYAGPTPEDPTLGGHGHLRNNTVGHEAWNFRPHRGKVYGYIPRNTAVSLERLGAKRAATAVSGVTVVWIARSPRNRITYIVGWYHAATVRHVANAVTLTRRAGFNVDYQVETLPENATLLSVDARLYKIPTAKLPGNLGQSPVWYGKDESFRADVLQYIGAGGVRPASAKRTAKGRSPRQPDPELRWKIEKAAVAHAWRHYESKAGGSRSLVSVEPYGRGWDLEATGFDGSLLKIEVKGLQSSGIVAELTPNEYAKMLSSEHREDYVIYIVTEALKRSAAAHIFRYSKDQSTATNLVWVTEDNRRLKIEARVAARLSVP